MWFLRRRRSSDTLASPRRSRSATQRSAYSATVSPVASSAKRAEAQRTTDREAQARLTGEADEATTRAAELEAKYMAPLAKAAQIDAAYGLGVQAAVFSALMQPGGFDVAVERARASVRSVGPAEVRVQG